MPVANKVYPHTRPGAKAARKSRQNPPPPPEDAEEEENYRVPDDAGHSADQKHANSMKRLAQVFAFETLPLRGKPGMRAHKQRFLECMVQAMCIVTTACASAGVTRPTVLRWRHEDEVFAKAIDELQDVALDFVEGKLLSLIQAGDRVAIMFYLRTRGRTRGYVEQQRMPWGDGEEGNDVFGKGGAVNSGFIALSELQREIPPDSLRKAIAIIDAEEV